MPENSMFFRDQTEQSAVKAKIVSSYFNAWSGVIKKWDCTMGYIDLFSGPGRYGDNNPSAPLLIIQSNTFYMESSGFLRDRVKAGFENEECQSYTKQDIGIRRRCFSEAL